MKRTIDDKRQEAKEYFLEVKGHAPKFLDNCPEAELDSIITSYFVRLWYREQ